MTKATYKRRLKKLLDFEEYLERERNGRCRVYNWQMEEQVRRLWYIMDGEPVELPEAGRFGRWSLQFNTPEGNNEFTVRSSHYDYQTRSSIRTLTVPLIDLIRFIKRKAKKDLLSCA